MSHLKLSEISRAINESLEKEKFDIRTLKFPNIIDHIDPETGCIEKAQWIKEFKDLNKDGECDTIGLREAKEFFESVFYGGAYYASFTIHKS